MAVTGGTHIIKWDEGWGGINDILIYKHSVEDFKTHSVLIVNPSQVAIVYDTQTRKPHVFREGRHEKALEQLNQNHIARMGIGDKILYKENTSYHIDVYFVNLVRMTSMTFGTPEPIKNLYDPIEQVNFELKMAGQYEAQITDPVKLKEILSGTQHLFTRKDLRQVVRAQIIQKMRNTLSTLFKGSRQTGFSVYEMNSYTDDVAKQIEVELAPYFEEFGLEIKHFMIENIEAGGKQFEEALAQNMEARRLAKLGISYAQERQLDVMQTAAGNEGNVGGFMGAGMGLGMGVGMGGVFGAGMANMAGQAFAPGQVPPGYGYPQQPYGYAPQGQMPPQGYPQQPYGYAPQGQMPPQGYPQQPYGYAPQGQMPPQGYPQQPYGYAPQGQMPPQGYAPAPAPEAAPAPAPAAAVCPQCGQPVQPGATVCACGKQLV